MKRKILVGIVIALSVLLVSSSTALAAQGKNWGDHKAPWDFSLDPAIDPVHEYKGVGQLNEMDLPVQIKGFMYIDFTGDGNEAVLGTETVGWVVDGIFSMARYNEGAPHVSHWSVNANDVPKQQGYVHWHPFGGHGDKVDGEMYPGYFLKHTAVDSFYFIPQSRMVTPGIDFMFPHNYEII
ncbi:MAG: hypothetical protein GQ533_10835 [Methanosarcinaceae archaeon]|nr:hypothetical protein [Methanosarcinaceae archaeon]